MIQKQSIQLFREMTSISALGMGLVAMLATMSAGCGAKPGAAEGNVTLNSAPFVGQSGARLGAALIEGGSYNPNPFELGAVTVTSMSFCVTQLKVEGAGGVPIEDDDGDDIMEVSLGLINAGDGSAPLTWGTASIPVGTSIDKIKVEVHYDPEICGVGYSVSLNGNELTQDVEMVFRFATPLVIAEGDSLTFNLGSIANAFAAALDASLFTNDGITSYIEGVEESMEKDAD